MYFMALIGGIGGGFLGVQLAFYLQQSAKAKDSDSNKLAPREPRTHQEMPGKDWEQRARIQAVMFEQHLSFVDLREKLGITKGYLSRLVWGTLRNKEQEERIAALLGKSWEELFASSKDGRAA
jgi:hypothetical protein